MKVKPQNSKRLKVRMITDEALHHVDEELENYMDDEPDLEDFWDYEVDETKAETAQCFGFPGTPVKNQS